MYERLKAMVYQGMMLGLASLMPFGSVYASAWIDDGWAYVEQHQPGQALQAWQLGVNQLEDNQSLIVLRVVSDAAVAIALAQEVDQTVGRNASVFVVQSMSRGKPIYYVLSARKVATDLDGRHKQLAAVRQALGVSTKLFSDSAAAFKSAIDPSIVPNVTPVLPVESATAITHALKLPPSLALDTNVSKTPSDAMNEAPKPVVVSEVVAISAQRDEQNIDFTQIDSDYDIGRFEEALWALEDLQKVYPHSSDVYYRMGLVQGDMLDFKASRVAFEQAIRENNMDDVSKVYLHLGDLLYKMGEYPAAMQAFEHRMKLKPMDAYTSYMLGMVYRYVGYFPDSIIAFQRAGKLNGLYQQQALYGQGLAYVRLNDAEKAQDVLKKSIALNPTSDTAGVAKIALESAITLANTSYLSVFGLYGFQYDSNVVLKPSTSPNVPLITGVKDFEHTLLSVLTFAPPPSFSGSGYKVSAMVYANLHTRLITFDMVDLNATVTPYAALGKRNMLSMDASFDYVFFNKKRYMDTIKLKPALTYKHNSQLELEFSLAASRLNYYQPVLAQTSLQDGWLLTESVKISAFSTDRRSSVQMGGHFATTRTRGSDWSFNAYGGMFAVNAPLPYLSFLTVGLNGSIERQKYQNIAAGFALRRRDTVSNSSLSLAHQFSYVNVSLNASYAHDISNIDVYSYVRMMTGINFSGSF